MNTASMWFATVALLVSGVQAPAAFATDGVPPAYERAARLEDVPARLLFAVALQESGLPLHGRLIPWPWTLNINGVAMRYANRWDACAALRDSLLREPGARADVGLGQINVRYYGDRVHQPCELLDPYRNLALAARILREQHRTGEDWSLAVRRYHRPAGGPAAVRYQRSVQEHLSRLAQAASPSSTRWTASTP